jgi:hypothetical protein
VVRCSGRERPTASDRHPRRGFDGDVVASDSWKSAVDSIATVGSDVESYGRMVAESAANAATDVAATANDMVRAAQDLSTRSRARSFLRPTSLPPPPKSPNPPNQPNGRSQPSRPQPSRPRPDRPRRANRPRRTNRRSHQGGGVRRAPIHVGINSDPWSTSPWMALDFGSTPLSIPLSPGTHRFRAKMADGRVVEKEIEVAEGRNEVVFR